MVTDAYRVLQPTRGWRPVVAHVPHASTRIDAQERQAILLDDAGLRRELVRMTDWHTDRLFAFASTHGATLFIHDRSRLVVDPERFADPTREPMEVVGQGAVYTRTSDGRPLRANDPVARERVLARLYRPYHAALSALVAAQLERADRCLILDCHSFSTTPLPSEADQRPDRPDICIGTDAFHTPPALVASLEHAFGEEGFLVRRDSPFDGALVPLDRYGADRRVAAVMVEVRRGLYCDEATGETLAGFGQVSGAIERALVDAGLFDLVPPT